MFKWLKKLFHRHEYEFVEEQTVPSSHTMDMITGEISNIKYRKIKFYRCRICGHLTTGCLLKIMGGKNV